MPTLEEINTKLGVRDGKTHCHFCKCESKGINTTGKFAHFSDSKIAKTYKVSLCAEDYEKVSELL